MRASGRTLNDDEFFNEIGHPGNRSMFVSGGQRDWPVMIREVIVTPEVVELIVDSDVLEKEDERWSYELLKQFHAKEITAIDLRSAIRELFDD